jgi:hypothetical protein
MSDGLGGDAASLAERIDEAFRGPIPRSLWHLLNDCRKFLRSQPVADRTTETDQSATLTQVLNLLATVPGDSAAEARRLLRDLISHTSYEASERVSATNQTASDEELRRLKRVIERERTWAAEWLDRMRAVLRQHSWLKDGRGPYEYDDDRILGEFAEVWKNLDAAIGRAERDLNATDHTDCPTEENEIVEARRGIPAPSCAEAPADGEALVARLRSEESVARKIAGHTPLFGNDRAVIANAAVRADLLRDAANALEAALQARAAAPGMPDAVRTALGVREIQLRTEAEYVRANGGASLAEQMEESAAAIRAFLAEAARSVTERSTVQERADAREPSALADGVDEGGEGRAVCGCERADDQGGVFLCPAHQRMLVGWAYVSPANVVGAP